MTIRISQRRHIQEDRDKLGNLFYRKTPTDSTLLVDVQAWIVTQEGRVKFIIKVMNGYKI